MKKEYIYGALALVGVVVVLNFVKKPKRNSEGFYGANGTKTFAKSGNCRVCEGGFSNYFAPNGFCRQGDRCVSSKQTASLQYGL